jgi:anti-sigma B factor antagonist
MWSCVSSRGTEARHGYSHVFDIALPIPTFLHAAPDPHVEYLPQADWDRTVQPTNFAVSIRHAGTISVLDVSGRLTSFEIGALRESVSRLLKQGRKNIVLNLSGLQYLDSSGIGELARIYVSVVKESGEMKVVGLSPKVEEILKITQLYQVFPEFPSEEEALESFPESSRKDPK